MKGALLKYTTIKRHFEFTAVFAEYLIQVRKYINGILIRLTCATFTVTFESPQDLLRVGVSLGSGGLFRSTFGKRPMPEYLGCTTGYLFLVPAGADASLRGGSSWRESRM